MFDGVIQKIKMARFLLRHGVRNGFLPFRHYCTVLRHSHEFVGHHSSRPLDVVHLQHQQCNDVLGLIDALTQAPQKLTHLNRSRPETFCIVSGLHGNRGQDGSKGEHGAKGEKGETGAPGY